MRGDLSTVRPHSWFGRKTFCELAVRAVGGGSVELASTEGGRESPPVELRSTTARRRRRGGREAERGCSRGVQQARSRQALVGLEAADGVHERVVDGAVD